MKWIKKGHIFKPNGEIEWMNSHTTPIAVIELENKIRIFFSTRSIADKNKNFISKASFIDVKKDNPTEIIYTHNKPIIELGGIGFFDEFGIMIAKPVIFANKLYMYYMGWQRLSGETAPYQVMLGLAISEDWGYSFNKVSNGPIISIDSIDPISIGNVSVILERGTWKMWYTSYTHWEINGIKPTPEYNIKYAESLDGINWNKTGIICIEEDKNGGVATPTVIKIGDKYHMWFGYRPPYKPDGSVSGYSIGYATSIDGKIWDRNDNLAGINCSNQGWDSEMICYPHVVRVDNKLLMFYCGNGFGESGFGYAELIGNLNE